MTYTAPANMRVGHIHLKVTDLDRSVAWYTDTLGLEVMNRLGNDAAFLSWNGYHHHVGLNTWESRGGSPASRRSPGLYHVAFLYPDRQALARGVARVVDKGVPLIGAADHGVSEAIYLEDPDGNGIELYADRDPADWPRNKDGDLALPTRRLDLDALLEHA
ncbi:MAG: VOC family protein [Pseudomonadota bacterium]